MKRKGIKPTGVEGKTAALLVEVWADLELVPACGVELCLPLISAWGGAEESNRVE